MNIQRTEIDALNFIVTVQIGTEDYAEKVEQSLKDFRRKANINGFRPGMAPAGMIKKLYGKSVMAEEVNKLLSDSLYNYLTESKLRVLGDPLPSETKPSKADFDSDQEFEFNFDIAIAPEVEFELTKKIKIPHYSISVDEKEEENFIQYYQRSYGKHEVVETAAENSLLKGKLTQVNADGEIAEGGLTKEDAKILISSVKDEDIKKGLTGTTNGSIISIDLMKALGNEQDIASMLGIKKQDFNPENSVFSFEVTEISDFIPAEQGQELFDNIYGAGVVKSEEEFREKIREEIAKGHENESNYKLALDIRAEILEQCGIELPDAFLKRWLARNSEKEIDAETMEKEYPVFRNDMIWQMLKDTFTKKAEITITEEELTEAAKNAALDQFRRYGINQVPDEHLVDMAKRILENEKEKQRLSDRKTEEKVIDYIKENITLTKKEVNMEDFHKLWK